MRSISIMANAVHSLDGLTSQWQARPVTRMAIRSGSVSRCLGAVPTEWRAYHTLDMANLEAILAVTLDGPSAEFIFAL